MLLSKNDQSSAQFLNQSSSLFSVAFWYVRVALGDAGYKTDATFTFFFSSLSRLGNVFHGGICESELGPFWRTGIRDILHNRCWFSLPHALYYQHLVMLCWLPHFQGKLYAPYNNSNVSINPYSATITCVILTLL